MHNSTCKSGPRHRVWIAQRRGQRELDEDVFQRSAVLLEPAEEGTMSPRRAARYVAAFNRVAAAQGRRIRAIALPVTVRYEGDPTPGQAVDVGRL